MKSELTRQADQAARSIPTRLVITCLDVPSSKHGRYQIIYNLDAWPKGTQRSRGWLRAGILFRREATPAEIEEERKAVRYQCYRYHEWQQMLEDEAKYGVDAQACRELYRRKGGVIALSDCRQPEQPHSPTN